MPIYHTIRSWKDPGDQDRVIDRLLDLRNGLKGRVPQHNAVPPKQDGYLLLATWNIRDFDGGRKNPYPKRRLDEAILYMAEIISAFDLVAVQEVNRDLSGLNRLTRALGGAWDYIVTDTTEGYGGNDERMAFLYDTRKVHFRRIAGEVVLPEGQEIVAPGRDPAAPDRRIQFARSPFVAAFQAGWFKFNLCTVHLYFGADSGAKKEQRIQEIDRISAFFAKRQDREQEDFILLGDFNIVGPKDETMSALLNHGYTIPEQLRDKPTNFGRNKHYDQIALRVRDKRLEIDSSGVFVFEDHVFRKQDFPAYAPFMRAAGSAGRDPTEKTYRSWLTWQMSDHLPMWTRLKVDFTDEYLKSLRPGRTPLT